MCPYISDYLFIHSSVHPSIRPSTHHRPIYPPSSHPSIQPFVHLSVHLSICPFVYSSICPSVHLCSGDRVPAEHMGRLVTCVRMRPRHPPVSCSCPLQTLNSWNFHYLFSFLSPSGDTVSRGWGLGFSSLCTHC